jgi:hypothetical protein
VQGEEQKEGKGKEEAERRWLSLVLPREKAAAALL